MERLRVNSAFQLRRVDPSIWRAWCPGDFEETTMQFMKERLAALGYEVVASTPEEFAVRIKTEIDMWAKVIRAANIKAE